METIIFCDECLSDLDEFGGVAVNIYEKICEHYIGKRHSLILNEKRKAHRNLIPVVKFLEDKSYVMTTDAGEANIQVKPLGHAIIGGNIHHFCIKDGMHE